MNVRRSTIMAACLWSVHIALASQAAAQSDLRITDLNTAGVVTNGQTLAITGPSDSRSSTTAQPQSRHLSASVYLKTAILTAYSMQVPTLYSAP